MHVSLSLQPGLRGIMSEARPCPPPPCPATKKGSGNIWWMNRWVGGCTAEWGSPWTSSSYLIQHWVLPRSWGQDAATPRAPWNSQTPWILSQEAGTLPSPSHCHHYLWHFFLSLLLSFTWPFIEEAQTKMMDTTDRQVGRQAGRQKMIEKVRPQKSHMATNLLISPGQLFISFSLTFLIC